MDAYICEPYQKDVESCSRRSSAWCTALAIVQLTQKSMQPALSPFKQCLQLSSVRPTEDALCWPVPAPPQPACLCYEHRAAVMHTKPL